MAELGKNTLITRWARCWPLKFSRQSEGIETVEYAVLTALIVAVVVVALGLLAVAIKDRMDLVAAIV